MKKDNTLFLISAVAIVAVVAVVIIFLSIKPTKNIGGQAYYEGEGEVAEGEGEVMSDGGGGYMCLEGSLPGCSDKKLFSECWGYKLESSSVWEGTYIEKEKEVLVVFNVPGYCFPSTYPSFKEKNLCFCSLVDGEPLLGEGAIDALKRNYDILTILTNKYPYKQ